MRDLEIAEKAEIRGLRLLPPTIAGNRNDYFASRQREDDLQTPPDCWFEIAKNSQSLSPRVQVRLRGLERLAKDRTLCGPGWTASVADVRPRLPSGPARTEANGRPAYWGAGRPSSSTSRRAVAACGSMRFSM
jgi:hypothetical protein